MEEHSADALTTSLVDECFFVLKKCAERAFSSHNISVACAVINHVINTLSREYKEVGHNSSCPAERGSMLIT
jgi:hypothetical protein